MQVRISAKNRRTHFELQMEPEKLEAYLTTFPEDIDICILNKQKAGRSQRQNKYLWGHLYFELSAFLGYDTNEIHDICKSKFLSDWKVIKVNGEEVEINYVRSTTSLTTTEFEDYCSKIRMWASMEFSLYLLKPNEIGGY